MTAEFERNPNLGAAAFLVVAPIGQSYFASSFFQPFCALAAGCLGYEVEETANAAASIDWRRWPFDDFNVIGGGHRSRVVTAILHAAEPTAKVVADVTAQKHAPRNTEVTPRVGAGGYSNNVVYCLHRIAKQRLLVSHRDGPR